MKVGEVIASELLVENVSKDILHLLVAQLNKFLMLCSKSIIRIYNFSSFGCPPGPSKG